ncbi:hypothetical protein Pfo_005542, partial [Paulownia fortunei]
IPPRFSRFLNHPSRHHRRVSASAQSSRSRPSSPVTAAQFVYFSGQSTLTSPPSAEVTATPIYPMKHLEHKG